MSWEDGIVALEPVGCSERVAEILQSPAGTRQHRDVIEGLGEVRFDRRALDARIDKRRLLNRTLAGDRFAAARSAGGADQFIGTLQAVGVVDGGRIGLLDTPDELITTQGVIHGHREIAAGVARFKYLVEQRWRDLHARRFEHEPEVGRGRCLAGNRHARLAARDMVRSRGRDVDRAVCVVKKQAIRAAGVGHQIKGLVCAHDFHVCAGRRCWIGLAVAQSLNRSDDFGGIDRLGDVHAHRQLHQRIDGVVAPNTHSTAS